MAMTLFTFGYEGLSIDAFVVRLKTIGVETVFDVRQLPLSRKKGFSKTALGIALRDAGIEYTHLPVFGCPRAIRDEYRADGNWSRYKRAFNSYLMAKDAEVRELARLAQKASSCLVCFEADFRFCHRSLVARAVAHVDGPRVTHLTAKLEVADQSVRIAA